MAQGGIRRDKEMKLRWNNMLVTYANQNKIRRASSVM